MSVAPGSAAAWWLAVRPRTLGASIVPVGLGIAYSARVVPVDLPIAALTLLTALALQVSTNLANDYYDHVRGIDTAARLGPARIVQAGLLPAAAVRRGAFAALGVALACGVLLVAHGGWPIFAIGVTAATAAIAYSAGPAPLASLGLGELLAFVFFGPVAVLGTALLQGVAPGPTLFLVATPLAMLVTAIMVVNNLRDIPTDRAAGKHTLALRLGSAGTRRLYRALVVGACALPILLVPTFGPALLLPLALLPLSIHEARHVAQRAGPALNQSLVGTARLHLLFGLALSTVVAIA